MAISHVEPLGPASVRQRRLALGLSQEQLAHRLGVSFATVNRWEGGRTRPRGPDLARLAAVLDLVTPGLPPARAERRGDAVAAAPVDRLDEHDRLLLDRLSIVPGSFSLELAEAVGTARGVADVPDTSVLLGLAALAGRSLLETHADGDQVRYRLHERARPDARRRLEARDEDDGAFAALHQWSLGFARRMQRGLAGREQATWMARARLEAEIVAAALQWAIDRRDADGAVELAGAFWRFWYANADLARGLGFLAAALALGGKVSRSARIEALLGAGVIARQAGQTTTAVRYLRAHLELAEATGDERSVAQAHNSLAGALHAAGDAVAAARMLRRSLDWWQRSGDRRGLATALSNLGVLASDGGDQAEAVEYGEQALALRLALGHGEGIAISYQNLGTACARAGRTDEARYYLVEALRRYAELGEPDGIASTLEVLAAVVPDATAARLIAAAGRLRREIGFPRSAAEVAELDATRRRLRAALGDARLAREERRGAGLSQAEAIELAGVDRTADRVDLGYERTLRRRMTSREREVLALVGRGQATKEIAESLALSPRTVERHLSNLYAKIGARGRADAIAYAVRTELADRP